jgi:hypothetical protein
LQQVIVYVLRIKQQVTRCLQASHKMHQGHFAGIFGKAEHAFAKESAAERHTI